MYPRFLAEKYNQESLNSSIGGVENYLLLLGNIVSDFILYLLIHKGRSYCLEIKNIYFLVDVQNLDEILTKRIKTRATAPCDDGYFELTSSEGSIFLKGEGSEIVLNSSKNLRLEFAFLAIEETVSVFGKKSP